MASTFKIGSPLGATSALGVGIQGLSRYAQARLDNTVARAVLKHQEALKVDAIGLYIWRRSTAGLICTCRQGEKAIALEAGPAILENPTADQLRLPQQQNNLPAGGETDADISFRIRHHRGQTGVPLSNPPLPPEFTGLIDPNAVDNGLAGDQPSGLNSLAPLDTVTDEMSDEELARILSQGGAIFGGDKSICGICFGTGHTHGYELVTGRRILLDASSEWPFSLQGNATVQYQEHPAKFIVTSRLDSSVIWTVDLPTFTHGWLTIMVRDNLRPANNLIVQWLTDTGWQNLTIANLAASDGTDRHGTQIRVINDGQIKLGEQLPFTHVQIIYTSAPPLPAGAGQMTLTTNFDVSAPVINAEFELIGSVDSVPRESIFQDTKYFYMWKVIDSTAKITSLGQVFGFTINARTLHNGEPQYSLKLPGDALRYNYRGLEAVEGGISQQYWPDSKDIPNSLTFPETDEGYLYNTEGN
jgi:hypothetical protein